LSNNIAHDIDMKTLMEEMSAYDYPPFTWRNVTSIVSFGEINDNNDDFQEEDNKHFQGEDSNEHEHEHEHEAANDGRDKHEARNDGHDEDDMGMNAPNEGANHVDAADKAHANEEDCDAAGNAMDEALVFEVVAPMISDDEDDTGMNENCIGTPGVYEEMNVSDYQSSGRTDDVDTAHLNDVVVSDGALPPDGDTVTGVANENKKATKPVDPVENESPVDPDDESVDPVEHEAPVDNKPVDPVEHAAPVDHNENENDHVENEAPVDHTETVMRPHTKTAIRPQMKPARMPPQMKTAMRPQKEKRISTAMRPQKEKRILALRSNLLRQMMQKTNLLKLQGWTMTLLRTLLAQESSA
jgi:hypothetical protein